MSVLKIGVIIGTTREGRYGDTIANWIYKIASARKEMEFEIIDLRNYPLPLYNEEKPPIYEPAKHPVAQQLAAKMASLDGYVFITAEYNHAPSGALKNAIDHLFPELARKPASFVGYGGVGAARAVEQLRLILVELRVAPLRDAVHVGVAELIGIRQQGKTFNDFPYLSQSAERMLDKLQWWAATLKKGRE